MPEGIRAHQRGAGRDRQLAAVGRQHPADLVDHQAVLMLILARGQQLPGHHLVLRRLAHPSGGARQRVGEHLSPADPQQQLGAGAQQAATLAERQGEVEGVGILGHQTGHHLLRVGRLVQGKGEFARQHHLGQPALCKRIQRRTDRGLEFAGRRGALHRDDPVGLDGLLHFCRRCRLCRGQFLAPLIAAGHIEAGSLRRIKRKSTDEQGVGLAGSPSGIEGQGYLLCQQGPLAGGGGDGLPQVSGTDRALTRGKQEIRRHLRLGRCAIFHYSSLHVIPSKKIQNDNDYQFDFVRR